jgi:hypothetical protein
MVQVIYRQTAPATMLKISNERIFARLTVAGKWRPSTPPTSNKITNRKPDRTRRD